MSMDPQELSKSPALNKGKQLAKKAAKAPAKKAKKMIGKKVKELGKRLGKKIAKVLFKIMMKVLLKMLVVIISVIGSLISFIGIPLFVVVVMVVLVVAFISFDFNGDLESDKQTIYHAYQNVTIKTIDDDAKDQLTWEVPPDLVAAIGQVYQIKYDEEPEWYQTENAYYRSLGRNITEGIEPIFEYNDYEIQVKEYTEVKNYSSSGRYIGTTHKDEKNSTEVLEKIEKVETWRGIYEIKYKKEWEEPEKVGREKRYYKWVDGERVLDEIHQNYIQKQKLIPTISNYSPNYNKLFDKLITDLSLGNADIKLIEIMFNKRVDVNHELQTQKVPLEFSDLLLNSLSGFRKIPGHSLPFDVIYDSTRHNIANKREAQIIRNSGLSIMWPVPSINYLSSYYGPRWGEFHNGIDIANEDAAYHNIYAAEDGIVIHAGPRDPNGFGQAVYIDHGNGIYTRYGHLQWDAYGVETGDRVKKGDYIGQIGAGKVGSSTGPHLHFEVIINGSHNEHGSIYGKFVDPLFVISPPDNTYSHTYNK